MSQVLESRIGEVIAERYELVRLLGTGGMGAVYGARQVAMDRAVAIKIIHGHLTGNEEYVRRFQREMQAAARVRHENSIHVYDYGQTEQGELYLVMELIEGRTLADVLRDAGSLPEDRTIHVIRQIARALGAIHHEGVIHRDLKPGNVMLTDRYGESDIVKVMDYGIARLVATDEHEAMSALTETGAIIGTPLYMSPEQILGQPVDGRSDLYALGVILYQCVAGGVPFFDETPTRILLMHANEAPEPLSKRLGRRVGQEIEALALDLLAKSPRSRPQTAADVIERLDAAASGKPSRALTGKAVAVTVSARSLGRRRWLVPVVALLATGVMATAAALFWPRSAAPPAEPPAVSASGAAVSGDEGGAASSGGATPTAPSPPREPPDGALPAPMEEADRALAVAPAPAPEPAPEPAEHVAVGPDDPGPSPGDASAVPGSGVVPGAAAPSGEGVAASESVHDKTPDVRPDATSGEAQDGAVDAAPPSPSRAALDAALTAGGHPALPAACHTESGGLLATLAATAEHLTDGRVGGGRVEDEAALDALERTPPGDVDSAAYWLLLARARLYAGQGDAVAAARRATAVCPDAALAHNVLGNALQKAGALPDAEAAYRKALAFDNDYVAPRVNLGLLALQRRDAPGALAMFDDVLARTPDNAAVHVARGHALRALGRDEEAKAAYCQAAALGAEAARGLCPQGE